MNPAIIVINPLLLPSASSRCHPKANITAPINATTPPIFNNQSQTNVIKPSILLVLLPSAYTLLILKINQLKNLDCEKFNDWYIDGREVGNELEIEMVRD